MIEIWHRLTFGRAVLFELKKVYKKEHREVLPREGKYAIIKAVEAEMYRTDPLRRVAVCAELA